MKAQTQQRATLSTRFLPGSHWCAAPRAHVRALCWSGAKLRLFLPTAGSYNPKESHLFTHRGSVQRGCQALALAELFMSEQLHMAAPAPHSAARLLPAPLGANGPAELFQLHLRITITFPNLPDESLQILPGSFLAAWMSAEVSGCSQRCFPRAAAKAFPGGRVCQAKSRGCPAPQSPGTPRGSHRGDGNAPF